MKERKSILEGAGYRVLTADSGGLGLEIAKTTHVDLALVEFEMPGLNGYGVAALLRAIQPGTRILLLSGLTPAPARLNGELDGILIKGDTAPRFLEQVTSHLAKTRSQPLSWRHTRDSVA